MGNRPAVKRVVNGDRFDECIREHGYSVKTLAKALDINEKTLRRIENEGEGTVTVLYQVADFLDVDFVDLCGADVSDRWTEFLERVK